MQDDSERKHAHAGSRTGAVKEAERRGANRYQLTATAEVIELGTGARFAARTTDLGPGGCFVDTLLPFPVGSKVRVHLNKGSANFDTAGTVVYSQAGLGMGIAFDSMKPNERAALEAWLAHLTGARQISEPPHLAKSSKTFPSLDHAMFMRLLRILVGKRILTEAEAAAVLQDLIL